MPQRPVIPNFFNPVASPLGQSIANLANTVAAGPQQRLQADALAGTAADRQQSFLNAQQQNQLKAQENTARDSLATRFGNLAQTGPDGKPSNFDPYAFGADAIRGNYDPQKLSDAYRGAFAFRGPRDDTFVNSQLGAGQAYNTTAPAFDTTQAGENTRAANTVTAENSRNAANNVASMARTQFEQGQENSRAALTRDAQAPKQPTALFDEYFKVAKKGGLPDDQATQWALTQTAPRNAPTSGAPTEQQVRARALLSEMAAISPKLDGAAGKPGQDEALTGGFDNFLEGGKDIPLVGKTIGNVAKTFQSGPYRIGLQVGRQWVQNLNFAKSGQGASDAEVERQLGIYLPVYGDPPELVKQKREARVAAQHAVELIAAGRDPSQVHFPHEAAAAPAGQSGGAQGDPLAQARDAISRGAPRAAVIQRLQQNGIDPAGL